MQPIKVYLKANKKDADLSFGIMRMAEIYVLQNGKFDEPHRHDFYTVLIVKKGRGKHYIDFNAFDLAANQIYFITPGQVHQLIEYEASEGWVINFSGDFLAHNNISLNFIENLNLFQDIAYTPPMQINSEEMQGIEKYAEDLSATVDSDISFKYEALGALLKVLLIRFNNFCTTEAKPDSDTDPGNRLLLKYKQLLNKHFHEYHNVADYAEELHVSADHLNRVVKSLTGKTAKEHIQSRITVAAKRLIYFTDMSLKELAFELGFSEPANFSAFFKKQTKLSPSEFKLKQNKV